MDQNEQFPESNPGIHQVRLNFRTNPRVIRSVAVPNG